VCPEGRNRRDPNGPPKHPSGACPARLRQVDSMAGLVGVISHDRRVPIPANELEDLFSEYRYLRGAGEVTSVSAGGWTVAARIDGDVPGTGDSEGRSWALAIGAIRASKALCRAPLTDLDGAFAAARFDAGADRVELVRDPFGVQAIYVAERDDRTYFSTCATALARHLNAPLDPLGSALFLRAGYQFGPSPTGPAWSVCARPSRSASTAASQGARCTGSRPWTRALGPCRWRGRSTSARRLFAKRCGHICRATSVRGRT